MINNPDKFMQGFWNWDILAGCFGDTKIKVMDIDGAVERNGKFLFIETKSLEAGDKLPLGQHLFLKNLALKGAFVIVLWGDKDNPVRAKTYNGERRGFEETEPFDCDIDWLRETVSAWFEYADKS